MPYIIRPRHIQRFVGAIVGAGLLAVISPVAALAACPLTSTSTPFAQFGDDASYSLLAGASFESGAAGWSLSNAHVIAGNESFNAVKGSHALEIKPGGVAISPAFCVGADEPAFRLFARRSSGWYVTGTVVMQWTDSLGAVHNTTVGVGHPEAEWAPTALVGLAVALPQSQAEATVSARLVFMTGPEGGVAIDDIYIDPYRR